ncbi:hypothetical protein B1987_04845 [Mycobacterium kansasii]|nr:hypothetical protein B1987_04845 [Mycobacterium kansasii]
MPDERLGEELMAVVKLRPGAPQLTTERLHQFCAGRIARRVPHDRHRQGPQSRIAPTSNRLSAWSRLRVRMLATVPLPAARVMVLSASVNGD